MSPVALQLLANVIARFEAGDGEGAVLRSHIGPNDRAAGAGGAAAQVAELETAVGEGGPRHTVPLIHHQSRQGGIFKQECVALPGLYKRLLGVAVLDGESGGRFKFLDPEPAVPQAVVRAGEFNAAVFVRRKHAKVVIFAGFCIVAGIPDLETNIT